MDHHQPVTHGPKSELEDELPTSEQVLTPPTAPFQLYANFENPVASPITAAAAALAAAAVSEERSSANGDNETTYHRPPSASQQLVPIAPVTVGGGSTVLMADSILPGTTFVSTLPPPNTSILTATTSRALAAPAPVASSFVQYRPQPLYQYIQPTQQQQQQQRQSVTLAPLASSYPVHTTTATVSVPGPTSTTTNTNVAGPIVTAAPSSIATASRPILPPTVPSQPIFSFAQSMLSPAPPAPSTSMQGLFQTSSAPIDDPLLVRSDPNVSTIPSVLSIPVSTTSPTPFLQQHQPGTVTIVSREVGFQPPSVSSPVVTSNNYNNNPFLTTFNTHENNPRSSNTDSNFFKFNNNHQDRPFFKRSWVWCLCIVLIAIVLGILAGTLWTHHNNNNNNNYPSSGNNGPGTDGGDTASSCLSVYCPRNQNQCLSSCSQDWNSAGCLVTGCNSNGNSTLQQCRGCDNSLLGCNNGCLSDYKDCLQLC